MLAFLGMNEVRFLAPVFIGDTIHPEMEVLSKEPKKIGGKVTIFESILNQRGEDVITAKLEVLVGNRPSSPTS